MATIKALAIILLVMLAWADSGICAMATADCSPSADAITGYKVQINGGAWIDTPAVASCGTNPATKVVCVAPSVTLCYDLSSMPNGPFTILAEAVNSWGVSPPSAPLNGTKSLPTSPSSARVIQ